MKNETVELIQAGNERLEEPSGLKTWHSPELKRYGQMKDLTRIGSGGGPEDLYINNGPS